MEMRDINFFIAKKNHEKALATIKALANEKDAKGKQLFYAWVTTEEYVNAETLEEAMNAWGWEATLDKDGNIESLYFTNEKLGDDGTLFDAIAPYVKKGSFIDLEGEDGTIWRWKFDGKKMKEVAAKIVFDA
jgi:hypothetical protein